MCSQLIYATPPDQAKSSDRNNRYPGTPRIKAFHAAVNIVLVTVMYLMALVLPIVLLYLLSFSPATKVIVVLVFAVTLSVLMSTFTRAKWHEVFMTTAT